jgi:hypothetical protein
MQRLILTNFRSPATYLCSQKPHLLRLFSGKSNQKRKQSHQLDSRFVLLKLSSDVWVCHRNASVSGVESNLKIDQTEGGGAEIRQ